MLAFETRAASAIGVAISVTTTIPAAAYLGVALELGELSKSLGALGVLGAKRRDDGAGGVAGALGPTADRLASDRAPDREEGPH
jgi:hypothetical protein